MPTITKPATLTQEDLKEDVDTLVDALVNGSGERTLEFAERLAAERAAAHHTHGVFKTWSVNNRLFLEAQSRRRRSNLKYLFAGVDQWRKLQREVIGSEVDKPYIIWGSPVYTVRNNQDGANGGTAGNGGQPNAQPANAGAERITRFRRPPTLSVYDWTQTRSLDETYEEPDWDVPLGYGDNATLQTLVESSPVAVRFDDLAARNENGWLDANGIVVNQRMDIGNQISTLAHELGHHYLGHLDTITSTRTARKGKDKSGDEPFSPRAVAEQEAALVQWLVMKMLGLDEGAGNMVTEQAANYLSSWIKLDKDGAPVTLEGRKSRKRLLTKRLDVALKAADQVLTQFVATQNQTVAAV